MEQKKNRIAGIDVIKTCAVFFVIFIHFFLNTKYYKTPTVGPNMIVQSYLRWIFIIAVPLFIMCTGFLNRKKTVSGAYYLKLLRVVIPYVLISVVTILVKMRLGTDVFDFKTAVFRISDFTANSYGWYVNMYIGLYALAPILNAAVEKMERKELFITILVLTALVSLPVTVNPLQSFFWAPNWWAGFYPVPYYLIGAYVSKYRVKPNKIACGAVFVAATVLETVIQVSMNRSKLNNWILADYGTVFIFLSSTAFFLMLYDADIKARPVAGAFRFISGMTLEIYLFSNAMNRIVFGYFGKHYFNGAVPLTQQQIFRRFFIPTMILVSAGSIAAACLFRLLYGLAEKGVKALFRRKDKKEL